MNRILLALCCLSFVMVTNVYATPISAGESLTASPLSFGGTLLAATSSVQTGPVIFAHQSVEVFSDPFNVYCAGCLDFVYQFHNDGLEGITGLFVASFRDFPLSVGFSPVTGGIAPGTITRDPDGNAVTFNFTPGVGLIQFSDDLVIQTSAGSYTGGSTTLEARGGIFGVGGSGLQPTPEPAPIVLLFTGLISLAGVVTIKRRPNAIRWR